MSVKDEYINLRGTQENWKLKRKTLKFYSNCMQKLKIPALPVCNTFLMFKTLKPREDKVVEAVELQ